MSDKKIRDLERLAQAGDVEAGALLFREKIRSGTTTKEKVGLAAFLGDEAATILVRGSIRDWLPFANELGRLDGVTLGEWVRLIGSWGLAAQVRSSLGMAELAMEDMTDREEIGLIRAGYSWGDDPSEENLASLVKAAQRVDAWRSARRHLQAAQGESVVEIAVSPRYELAHGGSRILAAYSIDRTLEVANLAMRRVNEVQLRQHARRRVLQWALA